MALRRNRGVLALLLVVLSGLAPVQVASTQEVTGTSQTCVVLLHGLWRSALSMKGLQWRLEENGYRVVNLTYPSTDHAVPELAVLAVEQSLAGCRELGLEQVDFVTHSLGGILVREYVRQRDIPGLHRVVMLGPPNGGSQLADYVGSTALLQPFMPEAVVQLGTSEVSVPRRLGRVNFQLGVIAGTSNWLSFLPGLPDGPSDGTVSVAETIVPGMMDFLELPVGHTFMMWDDEVIAQVLFFLEHGFFQRISPPISA
ncbi:MAG: alpha/beta fold hydrolase, partial [Halieaceae bacterium]|nr:alpha/beta fold hydrolase [Halieaceae bacterium]